MKIRLEFHGKDETPYPRYELYVGETLTDVLGDLDSAVIMYVLRKNEALRGRFKYDPFSKSSVIMDDEI